MRPSPLLRLTLVSSCVALVAATGSCTTTPDGPVGAQGWTEAEQVWWYEATQGSRLMPLAWFKALEQPGSAAPFLADDHMASFRFLPRTTSFGERLPVGFAIDDNDDSQLSVSKLRWFAGQGARERWIGLNCSACHTAEISFQGKPIRVDGGPSLVDFQSFTEASDAALIATRDKPDKWERFAAKVLAGRDTPANRTMLRAALDQHIGWQERTERMNETPLRYGPARVDAFGHIYNKVSLFTGDAYPVANPADAPVSYPFLWDIYRHDKLQWNGIAQNARLKLGGDRYLDYGAMGRNTGEVIGVFGDVVITPEASTPLLRGYRSSVWADNLNRLETQLTKLRAPKWPGPVDATLAAEGQGLFKAKCQGCHGIFPGTATYKVTMVPLRGPERNRTDPWMACNAYTYVTRSGRLTGTPEDYLNGKKIAETAPIATLLATTVKGALVGKKGQIVKEAGTTFLRMPQPPRVVTGDDPSAIDIINARLNTCLTDESPLLAYKSRPLDGIWATAPYLHNGSVPTLYHLLKPAAERPPSFSLGTREYDLKHVGYSWTNAPGNGWTFDTSQRGNSNSGHDYGAAELTEAQRWALVEYMKTL